MTWRRTVIGEFVERGDASIQTGPFGTQLKADDYVSEGVPVINVRNIGYGTLRESSLEYVTETTADRLNAHLLASSDIVFGRKGAVDRHLLVQNGHAGWMQGSDCIRLRFLTPEMDARYVSYCFLSPTHQQWMLTQSSNKATMASLNQEIIKRIPITIPPPDVQRDIVRVVSRYDELMENNTRRIKLLEDAARLLYEEWFVRLRFPGYEHRPIKDGVPEGWQRKLFSEVSETVGGGTPSTKVSEYWDGEITWVVPSDITKNDCLALLDSERHITEKGLRESSAKLVPPETILMTSRASVGFFALMDHEVCTNQGFINIIPHADHMRMYLLFNLMSRVEEIRSNAKGTTYPEISKGRFREMDVVVPSESLTKAFSETVYPMVRQVRCLKRQAGALRKARDLLLPRLMSGEVAV